MSIIRRMAQQIRDNGIFTGVRLPDIIKPKRYDLTLKPDFAKFTFSGHVKIHYESSKQVPHIILHANELEISDGLIEEGKNNKLIKVTYSEKTETACLEFEKPIPTSGMIELKFTGILNDKMKGFYRTSLNSKTEQPVYAATTQFESTDARRAFPCWDEPACKATFDVTLKYPTMVDVEGKSVKNVGLSNMPIKNETSSDGETTVCFETSPIMSTYLLAFVIGPFEFVEGKDSQNRPIRVYTTLGKLDQGRFALDVACKSMDYYEQYFNVKYPLPKMDLIAIPDFNMGAMENWGLVTYRETALLVDPKNSSTSSTHWIALVVAHEIAHQWFGNLVTMEWWTHLWLNEGFATFMEYMCVDNIFPHFNIWSRFLSHDYLQALSLDALDNSHPIEVPVNHPEEIEEIFDSISYAKGSCVIRMLHDYIGDEMFRKGMHNYLTQHAYKNASTEQLWEALGQASQKPVREIMSGWTSQKGYPWISVDYDLSNPSKMSLVQSKFSADGIVKPEDVNTLWTIPIKVISKGHIESDIHVLEHKSADIALNNPHNGWCKLNPGAIGLYRTAYPKTLLELLTPEIQSKQLSPMDRMSLQEDLCALSRAGNAKTVDWLRLLQSYKGETDFMVWNSIASCIASFSILLKGVQYVENFNEFGRDLFSQIFAKLTWKPIAGESQEDAMLRPIVIGRLVSFGCPKVVEQALILFKLHHSGEQILPADLRSPVYQAVSSFGDYESLIEIHKQVTLQEEKNRVLRALGQSRDPKRLDRAISFAMSDDVRLQDKVFLFASMGVAHAHVTWEFLKANRDALFQMYGRNPMLTHFVEYCCKNLVSEVEATDVENYFKRNMIPGAERTIKQCVENIRLNANWLKRDGESIKEFLSHH